MFKVSQINCKILNVSLTRATINHSSGISVKSFFSQTIQPQEIQTRPTRIQSRDTRRLWLAGQMDMRKEQRKRIAEGTPET